MNDNYLSVSWSTSRGQNTYGYNICRLDDNETGKRYRCMGGGYDMTGTVFGEWLEQNYQTELRAISDRAHASWVDGQRVTNDAADSLYGMTVKRCSIAITLDGGCGLESMRRIASAIGVETRATVNRRGNVTGFMVSAVQS